MGRKKTKPDKRVVEEPQKLDRDPKAKKSYSFAPNQSGQHGNKDGLIKVQLTSAQEAAVVELIQQNYHLTRMAGQASHRISTKKLTDFYMSLFRIGFKHSQIESAMNNTVQYGGDLLDALDWLCLNLPNDHLPEGLSAAMQAEDRRKRRIKFEETETGQAASKAVADIRHKTSPNKSSPNVIMSDTQQQNQQNKKQTQSPQKKETEVVKDWILRYTEQESSDEEIGIDIGVEDPNDPNERYLVLTAKLLDAKAAAADAKQRGDKSAQKQATMNIRTYSQEMDELEADPSFNPALKFMEEKPEAEKQVTVAAQEEVTPSDAGSDQGAAACGEDAMSGFALFEEQAAAEKPKSAKVKADNKPIDKRSFEYTRKQWTGKSPKQFLIDWVRKHEPKSPPPAYHKVHAPRNLWKSSCKVVRKDAGVLNVTPDILTETKVESEYLASTLALYQLCRGQRVYQLLPPPYRDVWLEWQDAEDKVKKAVKEEANKPRDQFVAKMMKTLKLEDSVKKDSNDDKKKDDKDEEEHEETWEDLASDESWDASPEVSPRGKKSEKSSKSSASSKPKSRYFNIDQARQTFSKRLKSNNYCKLLAKRQELPVYQHRENILQAIRKNNVLVIAGETGSGKSTQIPQFIVEEFLITGAPVSNIVVTEPRRISAQSLAMRVSEELGENKPGIPGSFCGYQVRFEVSRSDTTRLLYCTTGILLRKLQLDPLLSDVTHVIIDEVHERSVDSDFLLIIVKQILEKRKDFKVILMSATVDSDKFSSYFHHCPVYHIPGRTFPVEVFHIEDVVEKTNYKLEEDSPYCLRPDQIQQEESVSVDISGARGTSSKANLTWTKEDASTIDLSGLDPAEYSKHTRNVVTRINPKRVNMELIMNLLKYLDSAPEFSSVDGAVLIFMSGLAQIQELYELLKGDRNFSDPSRYRLVALHSVLSSQDQNSAFEVPPAGIRKIVIATNIAETGITIPDVVFVVDSGKVKENRYMESSQMSALLEVSVSKASARQRQGRAGRVRAGFAFRLYTKALFDSLRSYSVPEILRVPLEELCLHIMKCDLGNPLDFLAQAIDAPPPQSISKAMSILREVGACLPTEAQLTPLGHHLAALPVNVRVGKMLIFGAIFGCLEPVAVIAASMSDKSPFASPMGKRDEANLAKQSLSAASSDHLTLYNAFLQWQGAQSRGRQAEIELCNRLFLKRNTLIDIDNLAKDLIRLLDTIGFTSKHIILDGRKVTFTAPPLSSKQIPLIKSVLTAGLYSNVAKITFKQKVDDAATQRKILCYAQTPQGPATCHPSSVNRFLNSFGWVVYHEKVRHNQIYLRDTTLISPYPILLFGGDIEVQHRQQIISIDEWIQFKAYARTAVIFKELRILIDNLLDRKLSNPSLKLHDDAVVEILLSLLTTER